MARIGKVVSGCLLYNILDAVKPTDGVTTACCVIDTHQEQNNPTGHDSKLTTISQSRERGFTYFSFLIHPKEEKELMARKVLQE